MKCGRTALFYIHTATSMRIFGLLDSSLKKKYLR
jgi:hypothetical protein